MTKDLVFTSEVFFIFDMNHFMLLIVYSFLRVFFSLLFLRNFHIVDVKSFLLYQIRLKNMSISENSSYLPNKLYKYELDINIKIYNIRVYLRYVKSYAI